MQTIFTVHQAPLSSGVHQIPFAAILRLPIVRANTRALRHQAQFGQIDHFEQTFGGHMLDTDRAAHLTDKLLEVIVPELNREPRRQCLVRDRRDRLCRRRVD